MERVKIDDGTVWPDPSGDDFQALAWRFRYAHDSLEKSCFFTAAEIIEAYSNLVMHPAFTLKKVSKKVSGIRKAIKAKNEKQCTCSFTTKLTGDGCAVCNPEYAKQFEEETE